MGEDNQEQQAQSGAGGLPFGDFHIGEINYLWGIEEDLLFVENHLRTYFWTG